MTRLYFLLRTFAYGLWRTSLCVLYSVLCLCTIIGAFAVSDALNPPQLPAIRPLQAGSIVPLLCGPRPTRDDLLVMTDAERWESMRVSLDILDRVCPEIADWTRGKYECGILVFETRENGTYASYLMPFGVLFVNLRCLETSDAHIAETLAHEFRHSRQNMLGGIQVNIAKFAGMDRRELVEREAYEFEGRVRRAIRGCP